MIKRHPSFATVKFAHRFNTTCARFICRALPGLILLPFCTQASSADADKLNFLLRTDFGIIAVRPSSRNTEQRYRVIEATLVTNRIGDPTKDLAARTFAVYAVDCEASPRRVAELSFAVNSQPFSNTPNWVYLKPAPISVSPISLNDLTFQSLSAAQEAFSQRLSQQRIASWNNNLPSVTFAISEYACRRKLDSDNPDTVGANINANGGFDDFKVLSCTVHLPRSDEPIEYTIGFSGKGNAVEFGSMWQSTAAVTESDLGFTLAVSDASPLVFRISRSTGSITALGTLGEVTSTASGVCVVASDRPKKF